MIEKIRKLLKNEIDSGVKQITIARDIGISQSSIQKILYTNTTPTINTIKKIAAYFNIPVSTLIEDDIINADRISQEKPLYLDSLTHQIVDLVKSMPKQEKLKCIEYLEERQILSEVKKKLKKKRA